MGGGGGGVLQGGGGAPFLLFLQGGGGFSTGCCVPTVVVVVVVAFAANIPPFRRTLGAISGVCSTFRPPSHSPGLAMRGWSSGLISLSGRFAGVGAIGAKL